ncbi:MAG: LLM class flavin-dependent oxidoreductase [Sciscionella sp.]
MATIDVDIRVPLGRPLPELTDFVRRCEQAGFHGVGIHDHHHIGRDVYIALALAASNTDRVLLYPATTNAMTRHPLVLAALVQSLSEIAPERVMLTLAPGFLSVEKAGSPRATREHLAGVVTAIRRLLAGEEVELGQRRQPVSLRNVPAVAPRVMVLASGPKLLELAGEVADGVLMMVGLDPGSVAAARKHLHAGAARAGRDPADLEEIFIVSIAVGDRASATVWPRTWFRSGQPWLAYPSRSNLRWLAEAGVDLPDSADPGGISPALAERICDILGAFGPPEYCADRLLRAADEVDARHVFLFPAHSADTAYNLPEAELEAFATEIGPRIAANAGRSS